MPFLRSNKSRRQEDSLQFITLTLSLALAFNAFAQQPPSILIEGTVLNATTGAPIRRALIALRRSNQTGFPNPLAPGFGTETNGEGKFEFAHVEPDSYTVEVQAVGYVTQQQKGQMSVSPGNRINGLNFKLLPHAVITGRLLDQEGAQLAGMDVRLLRQLEMNGKSAMSIIGFTQTNDAGEFRIAGIAPGRYFLSASNQNPALAYFQKSLRHDFDKPQMAFARTFFPSSVDEAGARALDLSSGQTLTGLEIRMKQERVFRLRGKVSSIPLKDLRIEAVPRNADGTASFVNKEAILNEDGTFEISKLSPGPYTITAMLATGMRTVLGKTTIDITNENINNVQIGKIESVMISGTIRIEGSSTGRQPSLDTILIFLSSSSGESDSFRQTKSDAQGMFQLERVANGKFRLGVQNLPNGLWLKSITAAGRNLLNTATELPESPIEITLATGVGAITGAVTNSKGQPAIGSVMLLGQQPHLGFTRNIATDQNGRFTLSNIAPGDYKIYVVKPFEAFVLPNPGSHEAALAKAQTFSITPNSQKQIDLTLADAP